MPVRVVIDTNVFVSSLLSADGSNRAVIRQCLLGRALPLMGAALFHEHEDLLRRESLMKSSPLTADERETLFSSFLSVCEWVRIYFLWRPNLPDEGDNHLVELALAGSARAVVTNNIRDLRTGELTFPGIAVVTPAAFLESLPNPP